MSHTVQSVERAFAILETFDEDHPTRSAADIAQISGLARPTTYRMLQTLQQLGYIQNRGGQFEVTPRVLRLGAGYLGRTSFASRAQPVLDMISDELGEHVAIGMLDGDDVITLAAAGSSQSRYLAVAVRAGQRIPADRSSLGRVLLAHSPRESQPDSEMIRTSGYALSDGLLESGLRSIAVPIPDHHGNVALSLSLAASSSRVSTEDLKQIHLPRLQATAITLSNLL